MSSELFPRPWSVLPDQGGTYRVVAMNRNIIARFEQAQHAHLFAGLPHIANNVRYVSEVLNELRFDGLDQNPKGIRDLLGSAANTLTKIYGE